MQDSTTIEGVILPTRDSRTRWNVVVNDHVIHTIQQSPRPQHGQTDMADVLVPALCHPHIHLDKAYVLTCNREASEYHPDYSDLAPASGSFGEALANTSEAKKRYTRDDLHLRGAQLLATSYSYGVTSLRAFVEVDHVTDAKAMEVAVHLRGEFAHLVEMQICSFAQDPIFSGEFGRENRAAIETVLSVFRSDIEVLGTTPYVEKSREAATENVEWAIKTALAYNLHLDFHLDYDLDSSSDAQPMVYVVLDMLEKHGWREQADSSKTIVLGHCTHLTTLTASELGHLAKRIKNSELPVHFVGLPTSDLFMMGRPMSDHDSSRPDCRPRGTLQVTSLLKRYGLSACLGVNNVGNAFTPYGTGDPLQLACWGVGLYQAGTAADAKTLYSCVSWGARKAIGLDVGHANGDMNVGDRWRPMMRIRNQRYLEVGSTAGNEELRVEARPRYEFKDIVWDPPESQFRTIVR